MKKCLFILFIILAIKTPAQFLPIAEGDSISWTIKHEVWDHAMIENLYLSDTININSKVFYKTLYYGNWAYPGLVGYFREDTATGQAWFWGLQDTIEYLIMDLGLNVGDSIFVKMCEYGSSYAHITKSEIKNGRRVLTTNYHYGGGLISENLKFIEGVGPNATLLYQIDIEFGLTIDYLFGYLVCKAFNNNDLIYAWDTINYECGLQGSIEDQDQDKIFFFPNPAKDKLRITGLENPKTEIYSMTGTLLLSTKKKDIRLENFKGGVYLIKLYNGSRIVKIDKLIINNAR
jgi:hypothetical protein